MSFLPDSWVPDLVMHARFVALGLEKILEQRDAPFICNVLQETSSLAPTSHHLEARHLISLDGSRTVAPTCHFPINVRMPWFSRLVFRIQDPYYLKSTVGDASGTFSSTSSYAISTTFNIFDPLCHLDDIYMEINSKSSKAYLGAIMSLEVTITFVFLNAALVFPELLWNVY